MSSTGTVFWITGLSGAGKTSIANALYKKIINKNKNTILLDGDSLREVLSLENEFEQKERIKLANTYSKLCKMIACQNINVIISTVSMFNEIRIWNRENISKYKEIYIKVPIEILIKRDQKRLYSKALNGEIKNVLGINLSFEEPKEPDLTFINDGSFGIEEIANDIFLNIKSQNN